MPSAIFELFVLRTSTHDNREQKTMAEGVLASDRSGLHLTPRQKIRIGLTLVTCLALTAGAAVGAHVYRQPSAGAAPIKTVARGVKLADGLVKGAKAFHKFHSPFPLNLVFLAFATAKAFVKGASKGLIIRDQSATAGFQKISKRLKASQGAVNLVRYSKVLKLGATDPWESVVKGYKLSKSAFNVVDGVTGVAARGYERVKGGLKGAGVVFRALVLSKQAYGVLIQGFGVSHAALRVLSEERKNKKEEYTEERDVEEEEEEAALVSLGKGKLHIRRGVYCSGLARVGSEKGLPLPVMYLLAESLVKRQDPGCNLDSVFSLSIPCRPEHRWC